MQGAQNFDLSSMCWAGVRALESAYRDCETRLGRPATEVEVCEELGITLQDLYEKLGQYRWLKLGKFEKLERQESGQAEVLVRYVPFMWEEDVCHICTETKFRTVLSQAVNALPKNEQLVVSLRYQQKLTLTEIAALVGFSKTRVAQIHTSAMLRIRPKLLEK